MARAVDNGLPTLGGEVTLQNLLQHLQHISHQWYTLGIRMGMEVGDLESIQATHGSEVNAQTVCLREMLTRYLRQGNGSIENVLEAISVVFREEIAAAATALPPQPTGLRHRHVGNQQQQNPSPPPPQNVNPSPPNQCNAPNVPVAHYVGGMGGFGGFIGAVVPNLLCYFCPNLLTVCAADFWALVFSGGAVGGIFGAVIGLLIAAIIIASQSNSLASFIRGFLPF